MYEIVAGKFKGNRQLGRHYRGWGHNNEIDMKEIGW
jgi:hypothetical protein